MSQSRVISQTMSCEMLSYSAFTTRHPLDKPVFRNQDLRENRVCMVRKDSGEASNYSISGAKIEDVLVLKC